MSLTQEMLLDIMAYADGELDDDERQRVEAVLAESEEARAVVLAMAPLGDFVRISAEAQGDAAANIAGAVMARIDAENLEPEAAPSVASGTSVGSGTSEKPKIFDLERARAARAATLRRTSIGAGLAAVAALAASYFLVLRPEAKDTGGGPSAGLVTQQAPSAAPSVLSPGAAAAPDLGTAGVAAVESPSPASGGGVEVDHVEAPDNPVSVIYLPAVATADVNASSVVIWITDDKGSGGL